MIRKKNVFGEENKDLGTIRCLWSFFFCFWNDMIRFALKKESFGCKVENLIGKVHFPKRWP